MKVKIVVTFIIKGRQYDGETNVIVWPFALIPEKGDIISIEEIEDHFGELKYWKEDSKNAIQENIFELTHKGFRFINNEPVIVLYIGEEQN